MRENDTTDSMECCSWRISVGTYSIGILSSITSRSPRSYARAGDVGLLVIQQGTSEPSSLRAQYAIIVFSSGSLISLADC